MKTAEPTGAQKMLAADAKPLDENELWDLLDAVGDALSRKAAPHAWESIVRTAGYDHITKRRHAMQEPSDAVSDENGG
jgi:hypothetical protein